MAATIPPLLIDKPTPSQPLRYGIFAATNGPLDMPEHARNGGFKYQHAMCGGGAFYPIECIATQDTLTFGTTLSTVTAFPFMVTATFTCGSVGYTEAELQAFAAQKLASVEQTVVEQSISNIALAADVSPGLFNPHVTTVTGAGDTTSNVLSELEEVLYCTNQYGAPGVLHAPLAVFNDMKERKLIEFDGTRWKTPMGTIVSAGCYAGNDPAGVVPADGTYWLYLTGQTTVWRASDIQVAPVEGTLNRTTNQQTMLAEREYAVAFECGAFAKSVIVWT